TLTREALCDAMRHRRLPTGVSRRRHSVVASLSPKRTIVADPPTETKVLGPRRTTKGTPRREGDCLAIIHSRDETLLGKRIELGSAELIIGRGDAVGLSLQS